MRKTTYIMIGVIIATMAAITIFVAANTGTINPSIYVGSDKGTVRVPLPSTDNITFDLFSSDGIIHNSIPVELNIKSSPSDSSYMEVPKGWYNYMEIEETNVNMIPTSVAVIINQIQKAKKGTKEINVTFTSDSAPLIIDFYTSSKSPKIDFGRSIHRFWEISLKDFRGDNVTLYGASDTIMVEGSTLHTLTIPEGYAAPDHVGLTDSSIDSIICGDELRPVITVQDDSIAVKGPDGKEIK